MKLRALSAASAAALAFLAQPASATIVAETEPNDTMGTAQNLDPNFSQDFDAEITDSTLMPHSSIRAPAGGDATYDWYSFTVTAAGMMGVFDIDHAMPGLDPWLTLFDSGGVSLVSQDDSGIIDPGSVSTWDSYFTYNFSSPGTYFLRVGQFCCDAPQNGAYILHASVGNPVPEPATWAMMLMGFGAAGYAMRRRRARKLAIA